MRNKRGARAGFVYARYPENNWSNLDILDWTLAPGPDGVVSTARLENLKEGTQECEARIVLEEALVDDAKKARIGVDLAKRCQDALDEHHRAMWKTIWGNDDDLKSLGMVMSNTGWLENGIQNGLVKLGKKFPPLWTEEERSYFRNEARKGQEWFALGWKDREKKLFDLAGEVTAKLK